ncbi:MAG TPA: SIR2 family protein [Polyangiaceae bacterium]|nr:SIR2 family protein [Polyangiaceae bacterium]
MKPYRILILGAGFSRAAGLPLGAHLFRLILERSRAQDGSDSHIERDLSEFIAYKLRCDAVDLTMDDVDLEEFVAFLDIQHALRLEGSDTMTVEGNRSQLAIRSHIGAILQERTPSRTEGSIPDVYCKFASRLEPGDTVITFNYDILLERALEQVGKAYRLFPKRYKRVHPDCVVDSERDEVRVLKLHGSLDWFYRKEFDLTRDLIRKMGGDTDPSSAIFGDSPRHRTRILVEGPRPEADELSRIYRLQDPDAFYADASTLEAPYILSPASTKPLYATPLLDLWSGLGQAGALSLGLTVIGFSMPQHDEYLRQLIYCIARNFQHCEPNLVRGGRTKSKMALIDCRTTAAEVEKLKTRYSFLDWARTNVYSNGLDETALDIIFG